MLAFLSIIVGSGCGLNAPVPLHETTVETIRGKDSAGAAVELVKQGDDLTRARVIDVVLGTGEAEIISSDDGYVKFTIYFPAGATITYVGIIAEAHDADARFLVSGTWTQHASGIFGSDRGTWEAATRSSQHEDR